ncbi:IreB family regulatory phosphoprotein [Amphibacillus sp. Q70]|uniref:IreB family regulatory phosphoprotein n=1 Tax=Amphibacillus sp. Q70 TaxID=3453416 RepID=UPI003F87496E
MDSMDKTMKFDFSEEPIEKNVKDVLLTVYQSLREKGYHPINQIVGYLLSGDPAYIPRYKDARNMIRRLDRDELIEELVHFYIEHNKED